MEAVHGAWCNAKTWPTKCPSCGAAVFYFQCDCGSRVFFDSLGVPWPVHECDSSWAKNLVRTKDEKGIITVEIADGIVVRRAPESFSIHTNIIRRAKRSRQEQQKDPIVAIQPEEGVKGATVIGILREKTVNADIFKALNMPGPSQMTAAFLGPLVDQSLGRITVHEPSSEKDILHSYTIWLPSQFLEASSSTKGTTVLVDVEPITIPNHGSIWYGRHYEILG